MKLSLALSLLLILFASGVWGEEDTSVELLFEMEKQKLIHLSCTYQETRSGYTEGYEDSFDLGEFTDFWFIGDKSIYSKVLVIPVIKSVDVL